VYIAEYCRRRTPHSHLTPPPRGTPANIPINLIFPETRIIGVHFCRRLYGSIFIHICSVGSERRIFSAKSAFLPYKVIQGRPKLMALYKYCIIIINIIYYFGTNRKRTYDFLLVVNSNYGPILHSFRDTASYWQKIAYFSHPSLIRRPRSLVSLWNFALRLSVRKLESWGYPPVKIP